MMPIRNAVFISDTHCGDQLGLISPKGVTLDNGGTYKPSELQRKLFQKWERFWKWVDTATQGDPYCIVVVGDAIEGDHHRNTTPISTNPAIQERVALDIFEPLVEKCQGRFYVVRGTPAHVGESGCMEEKLAKRLGAKPDEEGRCARNELWLRVGGALVNAMHHIGVTSSSAHETSAVNAELIAHYVAAAQWSEEPPDFLVRGHRHRFCEVKIPNHKHGARAFVLPGWQLKTPFSFKIAGGRIQPPQFGGLVIRDGAEIWYAREWVDTIKRGCVEDGNAKNGRRDYANAA